MPDRHSKPCRPFSTDQRDDLVPRLAGLDDQQAVDEFESARAYEHDGARHALVGDHHIGPAGQDQRGAGAHRLDQFLLARGFDEPLRGTAQAQRREGRKPHARPHLSSVPAAVAHVVLLAGGTGGAKLARGLLDELGSELTVIANTGDDVEIYGAYVSPDPDLVTFWLADEIDERGWGLAGDTFAAMDQFRALGEDVWFNLGDRDLAIGLHRAGRLAAGARLTETIEDLRRAFGVPARVIVASDDPLRTHIQAGGRWRPFQEFMIRARAEGPIDDVEYRGHAKPAPEAVAALREATTIIIGPSNPVLSIDPILSVLQHDLHAASAPVVAVSPLVRGTVLEGPDRGLPALGRADAGLRRDRRSLRGPDRRTRRRPARRARADAGDRRRALEPRRAPPCGA